MFCRWRSNYQRGQFGFPLTSLIPSHFCALPISEHGFPSSNVVGFLCSRVWCERCLFVLLILTSIFLSFHCYYIGILSFFFRKCTDDLFKTWKHTSFVIFCYWYKWYKVTCLLVFHHSVLSHVSKVNYHVHAAYKY